MYHQESKYSRIEAAFHTLFAVFSLLLCVIVTNMSHSNHWNMSRDSTQYLLIAVTLHGAISLPSIMFGLRALVMNDSDAVPSSFFGLWLTMVLCTFISMFMLAGYMVGALR